MLGLALATLLLLTTPSSAQRLPTVLTELIQNPTQSPQPHERQGTAVALAGSLVAVSAPSANLHGEHSGVVKIYDLSTAAPGDPILNITNPETQDYSHTFGWAMALTPRWLAISAYRGSSRSSSGGVVHVYDLSADQPTTPAFSLWRPNRFERDGYGSSLSIHGNLLVVGANGGSAQFNRLPEAYVYDLSAKHPEKPQHRFFSEERNGAFGSAVTLTDSFLAVGAPGEGNGRVHLWDLNDPTKHRILVPGESTAQRFGQALAGHGDRLAIGGTNRIEVRTIDNLSSTIVTTIQSEPGFQAYVSLHGDYLAASTIRTATLSQAVLHDLTVDDPNVPVAKLESGVSPVALSDSLLVVGVPLDTPIRSGHVTVFRLTENLPEEHQRLSSPTISLSTQFGAALAADGNIIAIGAPQDCTHGLHTGAVYLFRRGDKEPYLTLFPPNPEDFLRFGSVLSIEGNHLAVKSTNLIHIFETAPASNGRLLCSVENRWGPFELSGGFLAAGYPYVTGKPSHAGEVAIFKVEASEEHLSPLHIVENPNPDSDRRFGGALSYSHPLLLVGHGENRRASTQAFLFELTSEQENLTSQLSHSFNYPSSGHLSGFGEAVALSNRFVAISATGDGSLFIFEAIGRGYRLRYVLPRSTRLLSFHNDLLATEQFLNGRYHISLHKLNRRGDIIEDIVDPHLPSPRHRPTYLVHNGTLIVGRGDARTVLHNDAVRVFDRTSDAPRLALFTNEDQPQPIRFGGTLSFDLIGPTTVVHREIVVRNEGREDLEIQAETSGLGYSVVATERIEPNGRGIIRITFDGKKPGTSGRLTLTTNTLENSVVNFALASQQFRSDQDRDRDGFNDALERILAPLGFNPEVYQRNDVQSFQQQVNLAGLFTEEQFQALRIDAPLISRDPESRQFHVTLGLQRADDLTSFAPLALTEDQISLTADGNILISLESESRTAFFRFECSR